MICQSCSKNIDDDSVFCPFCGSTLENYISITIGKSEDNDIVIDYPNVSQKHASILYDFNSFTINDLNSSNGVYVNGKRVKKSLIKSSDEIKLSLNYTLDWKLVDSKLKEYEINRVTVGRNSDNDFVIDKENVSKYHAVFRIYKNITFLEDLDSSNGTFVNNQKINQKIINKNDTIQFGLNNHFDLNKLESFYNRKELSNNKSKITLETKVIRNKKLITIGRAEDNDLVLENVRVSRYHSKLEKINNHWYLEDLASGNGTFVNGSRIERVPLSKSDLITIGSIPLSLDKIFRSERNISSDFIIKADNLSFIVEGNKTITDDISLVLMPNEFIGVIGPSGAGKTTLMNLLNGFVKPTKGNVYINNQNLHQNYEALKGMYGNVPQDDIFYRELTVRELFYYNAKLRLNNNYSEEEINDQVEKIITQLTLNEATNTIIGTTEKKGISGGQKRKVNFGLDLITEPSVLMLDEPTTGLDPLNINDVLTILNGLANKNKILLMVTHAISIETFEKLTHLIIIDKGGKLAYFGPSLEATNYFGVSKPSEIFPELRKNNPDYWKEKYRDSKYYNEYVEREQISEDTTNEKSTNNFKLTRETNNTQFFILLSRYFKVKLRDKISTLILLLQAPIIALFISFVFEGVEKDKAIFVLVISAIWLGCSNGAREIVSEQAIYKRERMIFLNIQSYLLSKITVLFFLSIIQCVILATITYYSIDFNLTLIELFSVLLFISFPALILSLLISSLVSSNEAAMALVPIVLIPQVILGGLMKTLSNMNNFIETLAGTMISRWGFESLMILEYKNSPIEEKIETSFGFDFENLWLNFSVMIIFSIIYYLLVSYSLKRKDMK